MLKKIYEINEDMKFKQFIVLLLRNSRFNCITAEQKSRWRRQFNGLPQ